MLACFATNGAVKSPHSGHIPLVYLISDGIECLISICELISCPQVDPLQEQNTQINGRLIIFTSTQALLRDVM